MNVRNSIANALIEATLSAGVPLEVAEVTISYRETFEGQADAERVEVRLIRSGLPTSADEPPKSE